MGRTGVRDLMFVGPLGDLGALRVMNGPFHTQDAEGAKNEDVVGGKLRRYSGKVLASFA